MATTIYLRDDSATTHRGTNTAKLNGSTGGWIPLLMSTSRGNDTTGAVQRVANTVAGPTSGIEVVQSGLPVEWLSDPLSADATISGAVTANLWANETSMTDNAAVNFVLDKVSGIDGTITNIVTSARTTELGTSSAAANFTATPGAGVTVNRGDRLRIRVFADDAGTMGSGGSMIFNFDRSTGGVTGDSFITLNESVTFESTSSDPSGSKLYLTDTASAVSVAGSVLAREAWTSAGSGMVTSKTATVNGWTAGVQITDQAGGGNNTIEWYTRALTGFTLGGMAKANIWAWEEGNSNSSLLVEIAIVANDGSSPSVWASACITPAIGAGGNALGELAPGAAEQRVAWIAGDDTSVSTGQRLRIRIYTDDCADFSQAATGGLPTDVDYAGSSGGSDGDTFLILPQTVTESGGTTYTKAGFGTENRVA